MAQPIIIGQYCADFSIEQPLSGDGYYFYKATSGTAPNQKTYYLATSRVTAGNNSNGIKIIPSTFVKPANGIIDTSDPSSTNNKERTFTEFRFKLAWKPAIGPDFTTSSAVVPANRRRYLEWQDFYNAAGGSQVVGSAYDATKKDRFVEIATENNVTSGVKIGPSALGDGAITPQTSGAAGTFTFISDTTLPSSVIYKATLESLSFSATNVSPTIQERATQLKYMILKSDLDNLYSGIVDVNKQLRYLRYNGSRFELVDLYDPDVTTTIIQNCAYRIAKQTNATLTAMPSGSTGGGPATISTIDTSWGIDVYYKASTAVGLTVSGSGADAFPGGFTISDVTPHSDVFTGSGVGFSASKFSISDATGVYSAASDTDLSNKMSSSFQDVVVTFNANDIRSYVDLTNRYNQAGSTSPSPNGSQMEFVFTNFVVDKAVEELFTNLSVTLLKVQQASSPVGVPTNLPASGNMNFLGFENASPSATPSVVTSTYTSAGTATTATDPVGLIVRDYYKFFNPARATQFKFYDLGKGTEYLWQVRLPSGSVDTYAYVGSSGSDVRYYPSSAITQNQRGWIMEYETGMTPPGVRLRWADTAAAASYFGLSGSGSADNSPYRVKTTLVTKADATIFNCIMCSSIDSTGACLPISSPYAGQSSPPGGRTSPIGTISITGASSPLPAGFNPVGGFKLKFAGGNIARFTVTQIGQGTVTGSPGAGVFSASPQPAAIVSSSGSPVPNSYDTFEFTRAGVLLPANAARQAVFIKVQGENVYLKYNTAGLNRLELASSNRPSDDDGFAWILVRATQSPGSAPAGPRRFILYSAFTFGSPTAATSTQTSRYISSTGTLTNSTGAQAFTIDEISTSNMDLIVNSSLPS